MTAHSHSGLPDCSAARILVVGDLMLDRYLHGTADRISPEAPVPVVRIEHTEDRPGGAANVAVNVAALGANTTLLGLVGNDEDAECLQRIVSEHGVATDFTHCPDIATTVKSRVTSCGQQLIRLDREDIADRSAMAKNITDKFKQHITQVDAVIFSDYAKGCLTHIEELIALAQQHSKLIFVDPKGTDFNIYRGADILTPNIKEFEAVVGHCKDDDALEQKAQAMRRDLGLECLLITRGEQGMTMVCEDALHHLAARAHEVYDVTGAGDTVIAVLSVIATTGLPLLTAAQFANRAAGLAVEKSGTATIAPDEFARYGSNAHSICSQEQLLQTVQDAKSRKQRIVMTNGCFDLLHIGHIAYLSQAASLGDRLIVAVNDDHSVKQLKGDKRPINSLDKRLQLVASLSMVDWVVAFSDLTPEKLITEISPDVLVKGGDYRADEIAGADHVKQHGGEVVILDYVEGVSTTQLIDAIQK